MNYIYVRQSSTKEDRSISCEEQISNCKKYAEQNKLEVKQVFQDINCSGRLYPPQFSSLAEADLVYKQFLAETKKEGQWRTGLGQLFDVLKDGDCIIVDELTRFYRPLTNSFLESALTQFLFSKKDLLGQNMFWNLLKECKSKTLTKKNRIKTSVCWPMCEPTDENHAKHP